MKKLLAIMVLSLCLIIPSKAENSKDFEIAGMSLGNNLLNYYSSEEIRKTKYYPYKLKDFYTTVLTSKDKFYEHIQINIRDNDKNYTIESIEGLINIKSFSECKKKKKIIEDEIYTQFSNLKIYYGKVNSHTSDPSGFSKQMTTNLYFNKTAYDGAAIRIMCTDWSTAIENEKKWSDSLRVIINSKNFNRFLIKNYN